MTNGLLTSALSGRVVITGAGGIIGAAVTKALTRESIAVTAVSLTFDRIEADPSSLVRYLEGNAADPELMGEAMVDAAAVVHLAAIPHPQMGTPFEVFSGNVAATFCTLQSAVNHGVRRAVIASSINAMGLPFNHFGPMPAYYPLDERIPADISDAYSLSKNVDEITARMMARRWDIGIDALRLPLTKPRADLLRAAAVHQNDPQLGVREGWSYLDLRDSVTTILRCLELGYRPGARVMLLAAEDTLQLRPSAELIAEFGSGVELRKPLLGNASLVDTSLARRLIGFQPRHSMHHTDAQDAQVQQGQAVRAG